MFTERTVAVYFGLALSVFFKLPFLTTSQCSKSWTKLTFAIPLNTGAEFYKCSAWNGPVSNFSTFKRKSDRIKLQSAVSRYAVRNKSVLITVCVATLDRSYMLICILSEWFTKIMHNFPIGILPETARINCRKLAIKSVEQGTKGEGHWDSKDIGFIETSRIR